MFEEFKTKMRTKTVSTFVLSYFDESCFGAACLLRARKIAFTNGNGNAEKCVSIKIKINLILSLNDRFANSNVIFMDDNVLRNKLRTVHSFHSANNV